MTNPPAYQYYAADFEMDTATWDVTEVGIYQRFLNYEWVNGALPDDIGKLAKIARVNTKRLSPFWHRTIKFKFSLNGAGQLVNRRMEEERQKYLKYIELQKEAGKRGAEKRWKKDRVAHSDPNGQPNSDPNGRKMALQSSSSLKKDSLRKEHFDLPTQEEINESSIPKIKKDLQKVCDYLYEAKIFSKAHAFKNKMLKENKSERAILHTLIRCSIKKKFKTTAWAYCMKIIEVENGNYNEYEYGKDKS